MAFSFLRVLDHTQRRTDAPQLVELPWTSDETDAETSTDNTHSTHKKQTSMPPMEFEPTIPAIERTQIYALHRADTGIGIFRVDEVIIHLFLVISLSPHRTLKNGSWQCKGRFTHSMPRPCHSHAVPLPCRALIYTCHAALLPCSDSAVSFVNVRMVAGNIRTASPTV